MLLFSIVIWFRCAQNVEAIHNFSKQIEQQPQAFALCELN